MIYPHHLRTADALYLHGYILLYLHGYIKTAEQRIVIQLYGDQFGTPAVDGWAVTFGTARRGLGGPNVAAHRSTASVPTLYCSIWYYKLPLHARGLMLAESLSETVPQQTIELLQRETRNVTLYSSGLAAPQ